MRVTGLAVTNRWPHLRWWIAELGRPAFRRYLLETLFAALERRGSLQNVDEAERLSTLKTRNGLKSKSWIRSDARTWLGCCLPLARWSDRWMYISIDYFVEKVSVFPANDPILQNRTASILLHFIVFSLVGFFWSCALMGAHHGTWHYKQCWQLGCHVADVSSSLGPDVLYLDDVIMLPLPMMGVMDGKKTWTTHKTPMLIISFISICIRCIFLTPKLADSKAQRIQHLFQPGLKLHRQCKLFYNTVLHHSATTLFTNTLLQQFLQHSSPTLLHNFLLFSKTLSNTVLLARPPKSATFLHKTFFTTFLPNTSLQDSCTTLLWNTSSNTLLLQHSSPTLLYNPLLQRFSNTIFSAALSLPTLPYTNGASLHYFAATPLQHSSLTLLYNTLL